ncbi:MAG: hypothetical protein M3546_14280 [Actinomycetota bacterium]|nr:hypothetical protein [Actinomycetota bacterium]
MTDAERVERIGSAPSLARACRAAGVPTFSPATSGRRISLLHDQGVSFARIGEALGQRNLAVTANTYTHVLSDGRELTTSGLRG